MNKLEQAARQILEAVEGIGFCSDYWDEKVTALREAMAEHDLQEPVAWMVIGDGQHGVYKAGEHFDSIECSSYWNNRGYELVPVYAAPISAKRDWVDLTDDDINKCAYATFEDCPTSAERKLASAVIAAFKEKNK